MCRFVSMKRKIRYQVMAMIVVESSMGMMEDAGSLDLVVAPLLV